MFHLSKWTLLPIAGLLLIGAAVVAGVWQRQVDGTGVRWADIQKALQKRYPGVEFICDPASVRKSGIYRQDVEAGYTARVSGQTYDPAKAYQYGYQYVDGISFRVLLRKAGGGPVPFQKSGGWYMDDDFYLKYLAYVFSLEGKEQRTGINQEEKPADLAVICQTDEMVLYYSGSTCCFYTFDVKNWGLCAFGPFGRNDPIYDLAVRYLYENEPAFLPR